MEKSKLSIDIVNKKVVELLNENSQSGVMLSDALKNNKITITELIDIASMHLISGIYSVERMGIVTINGIAINDYKINFIQ